MTARIGFCGDIMSHIGHVIQEIEGCSFEEHFSPEVVKLCQSQDEMWGNLESPVTDETDGLKVNTHLRSMHSGWPKLFFLERNLPVLTKLNFKVLGIANNHSFDFETDFDTEKTSNLLTKNGFVPVGTDFEPVYREVNEVTFAIFSVTCFLNPPAESPAVALLTEDNLAAFLTRINKESAKVDYVVVMIHWGWDYISAPTQAIRSLARRLLEAGVKIIYGNHPHILWPVEQLSPNQLICYSLGNFSQVFGSNESNQYYEAFRKATYSGLLSLEITKTKITPTFQMLMLKHNYSEWLNELGAQTTYWYWTAQQFDAWHASLSKRNCRLFSKVCLNGNPQPLPISMKYINSKYHWLKSHQGRTTYSIYDL